MALVGDWRVMIGLGAILPVVLIVLVLWVLPESPRWLVARDRVDEARPILTQIYPPGYDVDPVIQDIQEALEREQQSQMGWKLLLKPSPAMKRMLLVGIGTAVSQQGVGIDAIQYYLVDVLEESGISNDQKRNFVLILLGLIKLAFIVVGGKLFDKAGRRPLFFVSLIGVAVSMLVVGFAFVIDESQSTAFIVTGLGVYLAFFSIAMGPGAWLIPSEVFATSVRGKAMSMATLLNRAAATLMASTFLSTANAIGWGGFFLLLSAAAVVILGFLYVYLPETKGRSLEDMSIYFAELTGDDSLLEAERKIVEQRDAPATELTSPTKEVI